jgi:hypothetical protein
MSWKLDDYSCACGVGEVLARGDDSPDDCDVCGEPKVKLLGAVYVGANWMGSVSPTRRHQEFPPGVEDYRPVIDGEKTLEQHKAERQHFWSQLRWKD